MKKKIKDLIYKDLCEKHIMSPGASCIGCPLRIGGFVDNETRDETVVCKRDFLDKYGEEEIEVE